MKIAIFSDTFPPQVNGVAHVAQQSALLLAKAGHDVRVMTSSQESADYLEKISEGKYQTYNLWSVPFFGYPDLRFSWPLGAAARHFGSWRPDVIHSHTPFGIGWEAIRLGKRLKVPVVGTHHTFFDHYLKHVHLDFSWMRLISWKTTVGYYNRCNLVVCPSAAIATELEENGLTRPTRLLSNPVDTDFFRPATSKTAKEQLRQDRHLSGPTVIYVGRLSYEKSLDQVLQAFAIVIKTIPEAVLTVVGDGPERKELEAMAKQLGLETRVQFLGVLRGAAVVSALQASDIFITASKTENMPLSVIEAMAVGLPVVAVAEKGLVEIVKNEQNGLLAAADQPDELADDLISLIQDPSKRQRYSEASRQLALQYSPDRVIKNLEKIYTEAINTTARPKVTS